MIRKGDKVTFKPEWSDRGDETFVKVALEDEDGGRVLIKTLHPGWTIEPTEVVHTFMLVGGPEDRGPKHV